MYELAAKKTRMDRMKHFPRVISVLERPVGVGKTFLLFGGAASVSTTARLESRPLRPNFEAPPQVGSQIGLAVG